MEKACSTILMIMLLVVTLQGFSISDGQTPSNDKILVSITKNSVVYLSSQDRMVRAHVEITDYSPADGELFMKIVKKSSGEIVSESKIYVRPNSEDIWSTEIGYVVDNQDPNDLDSLVGSYEIQISPENGAYQGSATFQVLLKPIPGPKIQSITAADPTDSASYSNGDTITVVFSEPTNQPMVATKADLDRLFSFSQNLGAVYTGIWSDPSTLVISIIDSNGATPPTIGSFRITLTEGGNLTNAEGTSSVSKVTSPVLVGTFGTLKEASPVDILRNNTDISALRERAKDLFSSGKYNDVILICNKILQINSTDVKALNLKGLALDNLGKYDEAISSYDKGLRIDPKNAYLLYNKGVVLSEIGRYDESTSYYDKALQINPNFTEALTNKGLNLVKIGEFDQAILYYDKALLINPNFENALLNKGVALTRLGQYENSMEYYNKALKIDPKNINALVGMGTAFAKIGKYDEALSYYDKALQINPNYAKALNNKGSTLVDMEKYEDAITYYDKALKIDPNYTEALINKGLALDILGQDNDAITYYDKALKIDPKNVKALFNKAYALTDMGKYDDAISYYDKIIEIDPNHSDAIHNRNLTMDKIGITPLVSAIITVPIVGGIIVTAIFIKRRKMRKKRVIIQKDESKHALTTLEEPYDNDEISQVGFNEIRKDTDEDEWKGA